jgi:DNA-binding FrmR family transcriptional regulator
MWFSVVMPQCVQIRSVQAMTGASVLHDHAACCAARAIASGNEADQQAKLSKLVDLFEKV